MGQSLVKQTWGPEFKSPFIARGIVSGEFTEAHGLATMVSNRDPVSAKYSIVMYEILEGLRGGRGTAGSGLN